MSMPTTKDFNFMYEALRGERVKPLKDEDGREFFYWLTHDEDGAMVENIRYLDESE